MRFKSIMLATLAMLLIPTIPNVYAEENNYSDSTIKNENTDTLGLVEGYLTNCSVGTKKVHLKLEVDGSYYMQKIGFKNIKIERSADCVNWSKERDVSDLVITNAASYYISDYVVWVNGGNYYRVTLDNYAKNYSGTEEYIGSTSNYVWVS